VSAREELNLKPTDYTSTINNQLINGFNVFRLPL